MKTGNYGMAGMNRSMQDIDMVMDKIVSNTLRMAVAPLGLLLLAACGGGSGAVEQVEQVEQGEQVAIDTGANADTVGAAQPAPSAPSDNLMESAALIGTVQTIEIGDVILSSLPEATVSRSAESIELGRLLFWDPVLSGDRDTACATCHLPEFGYSDQRDRSVGTGGVGAGPNRTPGQIGAVPRNSQSVVNTIWNGINELGVFDTATAPMFWDNRVQSLALQALEPIRSREEMRGDNFSDSEIEQEVVSRLNNIPEYQNRFEQAYGNRVISLDSIGQALSDFQSSLIANNAPFDRWMRGDTAAMTQRQLDGMTVFVETGCAECHSGPMFSDFETHVLGVREASGLAEPDRGDGNFAFRTPSLRQLEFSAPYFHGGQESDLREVIDFYDNPNNSENPNVRNNQLDPDFLSLPNLNNNRANAIEAFLESLNDGGFDQSRPSSVPSGLQVGGSL